MKLCTRAFLIGIAFYASLFAERALAAEIVGQWMGVIGGTDHIVLDVARKDDNAYVARVANLEAGGNFFVAESVSIGAEHVVLNFVAIGAKYEANWDAAAAAWSGSWTRNGSSRPLSLTRTDEAAIAAARPRRPQDEAVARGPRPYTDEEVSFANESAHVKLAGTFSVPSGRGPFPTVLLIAASGREDRDEVANGHKVFVVLADYLLRRGIAVLRYDKRGVGASSGDFENATFNDLLDDAACAFRYLRTRSEVDSRRTGVIGHSEGGSLAPAVASLEKQVAFVVTMAGSGLNGQFRLVNALGMQVQDGGGSPAQVENVRALARSIFESVATVRDDATANTRIAALVDKAVAAQEVTAPQAALVRQNLSVRSVREALTDEPLIYLKKVRVPVLALVGSLDRVVPAGPYVEAMRPVLASIPRSHIEVLPQLNHIFQTAQTGSPREFATIEETISPVALKTVGDWIELQVTALR